MSRIGSARGGFDGAIVLDAFAGSGALGLEAVSRGALRCAFVERNRRALGCLRHNIAHLGLEARCQVFVGDVFTNRSYGSAGPFDLVLLDPPYDYSVDRVEDLLQALMETKRLDARAIVSWESRREEADERVAALERLGFEVIVSKGLAASAVTLGRRRPDAITPIESSQSRD